MQQIVYIAKSVKAFFESLTTYTDTNTHHLSTFLPERCTYMECKNEKMS